MLRLGWKRTISTVSIPHWFSLNFIRQHRPGWQSSRFHPTLVLAQPRTPDSSQPVVHVVSIPHWFSLNDLFVSNCGGTILVSIPHWFSLNNHKSEAYIIHKNSFHPTLVLAQPRYRLSYCKWLSCFHPTLVLAQPKLAVLKTVIRKSFHPTLVLAQPRNQVAATSILFMFPSHIGSRST